MEPSAAELARPIGMRPLPQVVTNQARLYPSPSQQLNANPAAGLRNNSIEPYLRILAHGFQYLPAALQHRLHRVNLDNNLLTDICDALKEYFPNDSLILKNLAVFLPATHPGIALVPAINQQQPYWVHQAVHNVVADVDVMNGTLPIE